MEKWPVDKVWKGKILVVEKENLLILFNCIRNSECEGLKE